jgi:hypothetical protein
MIFGVVSNRVLCVVYPWETLKGSIKSCDAVSSLRDSCPEGSNTSCPFYTKELSYYVIPPSTMVD